MNAVAEPLPEVVLMPRVSGAAVRMLTGRLGRWIACLGLVLAVTISVWSTRRVPHASWLPALLGLLPWIVGKYVLCPMRWCALSTGRQHRRWYLRVYAESELLGLASPAHIGADLWRMHRLQRTLVLNRPSAVAEVALDRSVGAIGLTIVVVTAGATLPLRLMVTAGVIAFVVVVSALVLRRVRAGLFVSRPLPRPTVLVRALLLSIAYQLTIMGLLMGNLQALGESVGPIALLGVFGASQVAGIIPGMNGASPREGALVVGLASLGVSWTVSLGAVALTSLVAWGPALLLGGTSLILRHFHTPTQEAPDGDRGLE
jgi:hypothetical protein